MLNGEELVLEAGLHLDVRSATLKAASMTYPVLISKQSFRNRPTGGPLSK